jgi:RNA ligase (TIGR02306 family)
MERQLVTIQKIAEIQPIEGADFIVRVRVEDWWCVAKKDEFKVGDRCIYYEIDSLLPDKPEYEFLKRGSTLKRQTVDGQIRVGIRLRTIKLKGVISQGLALPVNTPMAEFGDDLFQSESLYPVGTDLTEVLGVIKYEPPIPAELAGKAKGFFPPFLRKTDEERVQNLGEILKQFTGQKFYVTEKLDGSSMTVYKKDGVLGVCSRNLELLPSEDNTLWKLARQYDLENVLPDNFAVQGECFGSGVQGNPLKLTVQDFYVYNVWDITNQTYLGWDEMKEFCETRGLEMVPLIDSNFVLDEFYTKVPNLLDMADGASYINESVKREGIVLRPVVEQDVEYKGSKMRFSFKAISNQYLLGEKD